MIRPNEEKGFVLLTALLIMVILTLVGIGAILNSSVEINISRNERLKKEAFYAADAGGAVVPRIIKYYMSEQPSSIADLPDDLHDIAQDENFLNEINGTNADDNVCSSPDFQTTSAGRPVNIDIDQIARVQPAGQDIVFLGESGVATPVNIFYRAACRGSAADNRFVDVELFYRYIPTY
jgi:Tfp pilus assembly protein PilX